MDSMLHIGLDVHKKSVSYCALDWRGAVVAEGTVSARRERLTDWAQSLPGPWIGALEATLFTGWIYDHLEPYAQELRVGHPVMLKAISGSKKKSDKIDARTLGNLSRVNLFPECYMAPRWIRELRRALRFRNQLVRQAVRMKNTIAGLLMEAGAPYSKRKLHGKHYFADLLSHLTDVPQSVMAMLEMSHGALSLFQSMQSELVRGLVEHPDLRARVELLRSIGGVGEVTALTWALEVADPMRFPSIAQAVSYCGLCSAYRESGGKELRGPLSKQRNKHLQTVLVEAAKLAHRWNPDLAMVREKERARGDHNRATLAVARKLVAYLLAVDKRQTPFEASTSRAGGESETA